MGVARERNRFGPFVRLERSGHRFEPIRPRLVSKSSLILSGKPLRITSLLSRMARTGC
ncbi:hypothetical protein ACFQHW_04005 [Lapidilactobacillus achengensis]|uniref:Uncharacterized protein n=1 Tax=Lapidilactobacillus achengensis TaxID=2486000 RepID=A0ABW1UNU3_9LACO|nr:hypothetical protein [Lapidilactobacillus achengensis]